MNDQRYYKRTIIKEEVESKYLEESRMGIIYLPPGYNELLSYPVFYCQDGEQFFNFGRIATQATRLILDENIEPMIIIGVEMKKNVRTSEYHPEGSRFPNYTRFFVEEFVPFVENRFPIRQEADQRTLAGDSLGVTVSLQLALDHPNRFRNILSLSGAFFEPSIVRIQAEQDLSWLTMYMVAGLDETAVQTNAGTFNFLEINRKTKKLLEEKKANIHYIERPGTHIWGFWQREIPDALRFFFGSIV
ncbi:MAG: alpha/beta hydrolase [Tepidibacillus sp.]